MRDLLLAVRARGRLADPLELALVEPLLRLLLSRVRRLGGRALLQVRRVVALVGTALAVIHFEHPPRDVVEEVPVVGDGDHRALVLVEVALEPLDGVGVEVVRGLVEEQDVRMGQEDLAEGDSAALAPRALVDVGVGGRAAERVARLLEAAVQLPGIAVLDLLLDLLELVEGGLHGVRIQVLAELLVQGVEAVEEGLASRRPPRRGSS